MSEKKGFFGRLFGKDKKDSEGQLSEQPAESSTDDYAHVSEETADQEADILQSETVAPETTTEPAPEPLAEEETAGTTTTDAEVSVDSTTELKPATLEEATPTHPEKKKKLVCSPDRGAIQILRESDRGRDFHFHQAKAG